MVSGNQLSHVVAPFTVVVPVVFALLCLLDIFLGQSSAAAAQDHGDFALCLAVGHLVHSGEFVVHVTIFYP